LPRKYIYVRKLLLELTCIFYVVYVHFWFIFFEGLNFRHTLYPAYKSNRPPTPDTIVQGLQYLKASIKAMSIKVIEVMLCITDIYGYLTLIRCGYWSWVYSKAGTRCRSWWCDWNVGGKECWCWVQGDNLKLYLINMEKCPWNMNNILPIVIVLFCPTLIICWEQFSVWNKK
jgi:hypothetical protein